MRSSLAKTALPIPVRRALKKLGADISVARRRRGIATALMAERAFTTRPTLMKIERGDPSVSLDLLARALLTLGATRRDLARAL